MNESHFSDGWSFIMAVAIIILCAIGAIRIIDWIAGPKVEACSITFSDATGNRHTFIGEGEVRR